MANKKHKTHKKNDSSKIGKNNRTELENIGLNTVEGIENSQDLLQKQDLKMRGFF